eukprot:Gb_20095 [translate_table: standard]
MKGREREDRKENCQEGRKLIFIKKREKTSETLEEGKGREETKQGKSKDQAKKKLKGEIMTLEKGGKRSNRNSIELCNNCRRTGHYARDCPNASVCNNCGVAGYAFNFALWLSRDIVVDLVVNWCYMPTLVMFPVTLESYHLKHNTSRLPLVYAPGSGKPGSLHYFFCLFSGWVEHFIWHIATKCPTEPLCRKCKKPGHLANDCDNEPVCNTCGKTGHMAKQCSAHELGLPKSVLCRNCYRPGHIMAECPNEKACNNCRQSGHLARDCMNSPVCNGCGEPGHIVKDCPRLESPPRSMGPRGEYGDLICHNCKQPGHKSRDCVNTIVCHICGGRGHVAAACPSDPVFVRGGFRR